MDRITGVQLFARIVETGSFSKASADLGVSQPTATKHVAALEAKLGARLLNRNTRGVSATEIGALYYEKCKAIQRELEEADNLAVPPQSKVGGQLRISTSVAFGRRVATPLALRFMTEHPGISVDLSFDDRSRQPRRAGRRPRAAHGAARRLFPRRAPPGHQPLARRRLTRPTAWLARRPRLRPARHACLV